MTSKIHRTLCLAVGLTASLAFAGCTHYVKTSDFDAAIAKLQGTDQNLQQQIDSLSQDMKSQFAKYDAQITAMQGRINVDAIAHFAFDESNLRDQDKPKLDEFAKIMRSHHSDALVTVEGFADPAGSTSYNKRLGLERANAVRDYLINQGGMPASQVRAVSYGQEKDRQVKPGATHAEGEANRRATLVIDFAGSGGNSTMTG